MYESNQYINRHLLRLFECSQIFNFYKFLKTPEARTVVQFSPEDNPNTFSFETFKVRKACPELYPCQNSLVLLLERSGMTIKKLVRMSQKIGKWSVTHQTLSLKSTKEEIMQVWYKNEIINFMKKKGVLPNLYNEIQKNGNFVKWSPEGDSIIIHLEWEEFYLGLRINLRRLGFSILSFPSITHPHLCRESSMQYMYKLSTAWLVIYLMGIQMKRDQKTARKAREKQNKMMVKVEEKQIKEESKTQQVGSTIISNKIQKKQNIMVCQPKQQLKQSDLNNEWSNAQIRLLFRSLKKVIESETVAFKLALANIQRFSVQLVLGPIFILIDSILGASCLPLQQEKQTNHPDIKPDSTTLLSLIDDIVNVKKRMEMLQAENKKLKALQYKD